MGVGEGDIKGTKAIREVSDYSVSQTEGYCGLWYL